MKKNKVIKKIIATVLAAATVITAVPLSAVTANAASSDLVTIKSVKQSDAALKKMAYFYGGDAGDYKTTCKKTGKDQYTVTTTNQYFGFYTGKDNCIDIGDLKLTLNTSKLKKKVKKTKNYTYTTDYWFEIWNSHGSLLEDFECGKKKTVSSKLEFSDFTKRVKTKDRYKNETYDKGSFHVSYSLNSYLPEEYNGETIKIKIYRQKHKAGNDYWGKKASELIDRKLVQTIKIKFNVNNPQMIAEKEYQRCLDWLNAQSYDNEYADQQKVYWMKMLTSTWFYGTRYGDGYGYNGYEEIVQKNVRTPHGDYEKVWHGGACEEHARLFVELAQDMGYECQLVTDHGQDHAFAIITVNGERYFVETTNGGTVTTPISTQNINKLEGGTIKECFGHDKDCFVGLGTDTKYVKNGRNILTGELYDYEEDEYIEGSRNLNPPNALRDAGF